MKDRLLIATAQEGMVRIYAAITTEMVNEAVKMHECAPTAAAALGRMLTAGALMGAMLKNDKDKLTLKIDGGGEAQGVVVTAYSDAHVKGYINNPKVDLPANSKGKLDVGGAIGLDGDLLVIRDMGLKDPYVGQAPIVTGEIGDDLAYYFTVSEQTPSAVGLGVLVEKQLNVSAAGGFIIQMMPGANEFIADILMFRLQEIPSITQLISEGMTIEQILEYIFEDMGLKIMDNMSPRFQCDCSRERVEKALMSVGEKDLREIYEEGKTEELKCHFCNKSYIFTNKDVEKILDEIKK